MHLRLDLAFFLLLPFLLLIGWRVLQWLQRRLLLTASLVPIIAVVLIAQSSAPPAPTNLRILTGPVLQLALQSNLTYMGAFLVPQDGALGGGYSGTGLAYNPANNSLFISCNGPGSCQSTFFAGWAEITIPAAATWSKSATIATDGGAPTSTYIQNVTEIGGSSWVASFDPTGMCGAGSGHYASGAVVTGGNLIWNAWTYYLGISTCPTGSVYSHPVNLSSGPPMGGYPNASQGPWIVGTNAGHVMMWAALIPPTWQTALGGNVGVGAGCTATISAVSGGPALTVFNTSAFSGAPNSNLAATPLIDYTVDASGNDALGSYNSAGNLFGQTCQVGGAVIPSNFRSVLFFGLNSPPANNTTIPNALHLTPWPCYGAGVVNKALNGTIDPSGFPYCYDPPNANQGTHGYPYSYQVWAYDLNDLAAVKAGTKMASQVIPYAVWNYTTPSGTTLYATGDPLSAHDWGNGGAALDDTNHFIYQAQAASDKNGGPIINVWKIQ